MKSILAIVIISFIRGGVTGYLIRDDNIPEIKKETTREIKEDISISKKEIETISPAKIYTVPIAAKHDTGSPLPYLREVEDYSTYPFIPSQEGKFEEVAEWDTTTQEGFEAYVEYYTQRKFFKNRFVIPEKTVTKTVSETTIERIIEYQYPEWELALGVQVSSKQYAVGNFPLPLGEGRVRAYPFVSLAYNMDLWIVTGSIEGRMYADAGLNKFSPGLEGKIRVGL